MFSHLINARLKAAENALRDGRLDEAYRLAASPDLRVHRRGAAVLSALTERFVGRARAHYRADRFPEALADLDRAEEGRGMTDQIAELRAQVQAVAAEQQRRQQSRRVRVDAAKERIERGSLGAGRRILERASETDHDARHLRSEIAGRADEARSVVFQAEQLMAQGRLAAAAQRVRHAKSIDAHGESVIRVETSLCHQVFDNAGAAILQGRLGRAADELACLGSLGDSLPAKRELTDVLATARQAARALEAGQYNEARRHAMSLARLASKATWVQKVIEQLGQAIEVQTSLCAGPLGERVTGSADGDKPAGAPASISDTVALPGRTPRAPSALPDRLLLLVDGGGSYLLLRRDQMSMGRVACADPADVPVFSDLAERHANLARVDDDYFLFSARDVEVAGKKTKHQLLRDGDRILLGRKAKFTFRLPSRRSATATLDLSDTTKMPQDVRRVVLFHQHATIGQSPGAHIYCRHATPALVLFERAGTLWIRPRSDGHVDREAKQVRLGEPIEIGGVSLVLEPWQTRRTDGATA